MIEWKDGECPYCNAYNAAVIKQHRGSGWMCGMCSTPLDGSEVTQLLPNRWHILSRKV